MSPRVAASTSGDLEAPKESDPLLLGLAQLHTTEGRDDALESRLSRARRLLYISHFFNQFSGISWQFCLVLFLAAFSNYESLILVSSYGLLSSGAVCYFGTAAGRFIDGTNRLFVARSFIGLENFAVLSATLCCYVLLNRANLNQDTEFEGIPSDPFSVFLLVGVHICGAAAQVLDTGFLVAVERDWVVVMSKCVSYTTSYSEGIYLENQKKWLSETNVAMRQIDLCCKVVAPAIAGFYIAFYDDGTGNDHGSDLKESALFVGFLNIIALIVEYICTAEIYSMIPSLASKDSAPREDTPATLGENSDSQKAAREVPSKSGLLIYLHQKVSWAGIGLSLLYLNVLSFGSIMTAYLVWKGMRMDTIGVWRGVSSAVGLAGTFVFHFLSKRITLIDTGMCSIIFQFFCLSLSFASLFVDDFNASLTMLIFGVCASRVGLWVFDISVTQLMQLHIPEKSRGLVGGVQQSLNSFFGMLSFALGIVIPDPQDFHYYVSVGYTSVGVAVLLFWLGIHSKKQRLSNS